MVARTDLRQVSPFVYEIPKSYRQDMRTVARLYGDEEIIARAQEDRSLDQLVNTATLPGIVGPALAMPDIHQGYGFPIGGVVATDTAEGVISPGGVGYDICCGVRLLGSALHHEEIAAELEDLATAMQRHIPSGVGETGFIRLSASELDEVLEQGARWALRRGFARKADLERTEERGCMAGADAARCSPRAKERGRDQVGTLGAGNHFCEIDVVDEVFDAEAAEAFGLFPGQVCVQIHCGSRGLGHQVCTDYVNRFQKEMRRYRIELPDRELVSVPVSSPEGQDYLAAMQAAANYAWANRQVLAHQCRQAFEEVLRGKVRDPDLFQIYDIAHNMAKIEEHEVGGKRVRVCVHRKGATRAFGPGSLALPSDLRDIGQPVLVPGSMGTASWVLVGTAQSMRSTFGSSCHGAGRQMSRAQAKRQIRGEELRRELEAEGVRVRAGSLSGLAEEAPSAYKDVDRVVEVTTAAGIARKVARLRPLAVIKG